MIKQSHFGCHFDSSAYLRVEKSHDYSELKHNCHSECEAKNPAKRVLIYFELKPQALDPESAYRRIQDDKKTYRRIQDDKKTYRRIQDES